MTDVADVSSLAVARLARGNDSDKAEASAAVGDESSQTQPRAWCLVMAGDGVQAARVVVPR